jgi:Trp operon repressor
MPTMTEQTYTLEDLRDIHQERMNAQTLADEKADEEGRIARALLRQGHRQRELAPILGVSRGRIAQIARMADAEEVK